MATNDEIVKMTDEYLIANYGRVPLAMVRGEGSKLWNADGKEYLDLFPGFGAGGVSGHCHPEVVAAVRGQAGELFSHGNLFTNAPQVELARALSEKGFGGRTFYCHSGAEANEAALKLARLAAGPGRYKIISCHGCFHGRTMGALSLTPEKYQKGFEPMLAGNVKVDYGDIDALAAAVDDETAGVILEPIQGEGGVNVPSREYMQGVRALCDERGLTLICDEVWTAPARTGQWFAYQHFGIEPDIMTLGKALGGGLPVAAMVARPALAEQLTPGTHGCTLGGNPVCMAAGAAVARLIDEQDLCARATRTGEAVVEQVRRADVESVADVRGKGLMIGIELNRPGREVVMECLKRGLIVNCTQDRILRLAPALTIDPADLAAGVDLLIEILRA